MCCTHAFLLDAPSPHFQAPWLLLLLLGVYLACRLVIGVLSFASHPEEADALKKASISGGLQPFAPLQRLMVGRAQLGNSGARKPSCCCCCCWGAVIMTVTGAPHHVCKYLCPTPYVTPSCTAQLTHAPPSPLNAMAAGNRASASRVGQTRPV